jgi:hypothetical protein
MDLRVSAVFAPKALFMVAGVIELREREIKDYVVVVVVVGASSSSAAHDGCWWWSPS